MGAVKPWPSMAATHAVKQKGNTMLDINIETLNALSRMFQFNIHGDAVVKDGPRAGLTTWDLEFPDMTLAMSFAETILGHVVDVDIRQGDSISSLWDTVTITLTCGE
jgi:hypothetical protein